jgi:PTS system mannose-specific IIA component
MGLASDAGVLLVVHGDYGRPLLEAAETIVGPLQVSIATVCPEADAGQVRRSIQRELQRMGRASDVLVLTDLCGSTPANVCQCVIDDLPGCAVLSGLNLPMLIKLSTCDRSQGARRLADELLGTGRRSIVANDTPDDAGAAGD